jgi:hypothetical protein
MDASTKDKQVPAQAEAPAAPEQHETHEASKRPVWSRSINRVDCSIWEHEQDGKARYTVAISRSYRDRSNQWKRSYYFDKQDLDDVITVAREASNEMLNLQNLAQVVGED